MTKWLIEKNGAQLVVHELVAEVHVCQGWTAVGEYTPDNANLPNIEDMTVDELKQFLTDNHVDYDNKAKKAELVKLAKEVAG